MRKTFCDRCGTECVNSVGHLSGHVEHTTRQGQSVGYDEIPGSDLCGDCMTSVAEFAGLKVTPRELEKDGPGFISTFEGGQAVTFDAITVGDVNYLGPDSTR